MATKARDRSTDDEDEKGTDVWMILSLVVIAIIAALGLFVAFSGGGPKRPAGARSPVGVAAGPSPVSRVGRGTTTPAKPGGCNLPIGNQTVPTAAPAGTAWELVGSMAAPTAPSQYGPERMVAGFRRCFADDPIGALYATVNVWAAATQYPNAVVLEHLSADTPIRAQAIKDARAQGNTLLDAASPLQVVGYSYLSYSPTDASISLAFRVENGKLVSFYTSLRWVNGDWLYVIPPNGSPGAAQIGDLTGFVPWGKA